MKDTNTFSLLTKGTRWLRTSLNSATATSYCWREICPTCTGLRLIANSPIPPVGSQILAPLHRFIYLAGKEGIGPYVARGWQSGFGPRLPLRQSSGIRLRAGQRPLQIGALGGIEALAARRAGAEVALFAAVGDDADASALRRLLSQNGIEAVLQTVPDAPSGSSASIIADDGAFGAVRPALPTPCSKQGQRPCSYWIRAACCSASARRPPPPAPS